RERRPVHAHGGGDARASAAQARGARGDRDRRRRRLSHAMTPGFTGGRRLWPRRMRSRLAVMYTILIFLAGVVLLAVTYALVASVLLPGQAKPPRLSPRDTAL